MARVNGNIYFQQETPKIFGAVTEGMEQGRKLSELAKQSERDAYNFEQKKLADADAAKQRKTQQAQLEAAEYGRIFGGVKDQAGWQSGLQEWQKLGYGGADQMPAEFDPSFNNTILARSMPLAERHKQELQKQEFELRKNANQRENRLADAQIGKYNSEAEKNRLAANGGEGKTEGTKALDKDFAKDYNDWTSGGAKIAQSEILKLKGVADQLRNKSVSTGGFTGMFPDRMTSGSVLKSRADVQSTVMNSLKAILGAQFTEKEGDRIIKNTWNEGDTTQNNLARIDRLVGDLENQARDKAAKAQYFQEKGTLAGFKSGSAPSAPHGTDFNAMPDDQLAAAYQKMMGSKNANAR